MIVVTGAAGRLGRRVEEHNNNRLANLPESSQ